MKKGDQEVMNRLREVIAESGRTNRSISLDARLGGNFVTQLLATGRIPSVENLFAILSAFPEETKLYVLLGYKFSGDDVEVLKHVARLSPDSRDYLLKFLEKSVDG